MKDLLKIIKKLDLFAQPIFTFNTNRNKKTHEKKFTIKHGSFVGGLVTILCASCSLMYFSHNIRNMYGGSYDHQYSNIQTNHMKNGFDQISIQNTTFLPIIELSSRSDKQKDIDLIDIFKNEKKHWDIDMSKLNRYI